MGTYKPGTWTAPGPSRNPALFIETPEGTWKAVVHEDDSTWYVRGPDPDNPAHYAEGEVSTADPDVRTGNPKGRAAAAKKRARAYILAQINTAPTDNSHSTRKLRVQPLQDPPNRHHSVPKKSPALLDREIAEALAGVRTSSAFEEAKVELALIEKELAEATAVMHEFPRGAMGLPPESVRLSPEYRAAKARTDKAFAQLRAFNTTYVKTFAKELRAERDKRYGRSS